MTGILIQEIKLISVFKLQLRSETEEIKKNFLKGRFKCRKAKWLIADHRHQKKCQSAGDWRQWTERGGSSLFVRFRFHSCCPIPQISQSNVLCGVRRAPPLNRFWSPLLARHNLIRITLFGDCLSPTTEHSFLLLLLLLTTPPNALFVCDLLQIESESPRGWVDHQVASHSFLFFSIIIHIKHHLRCQRLKLKKIFGDERLFVELNAQRDLPTVYYIGCPAPDHPARRMNDWQPHLTIWEKFDDFSLNILVISDYYLLINSSH